MAYRKVHEVAAHARAVAHRPTFAVCESVFNFGAIRVTFKPLRIFLRIRQYLAVIGDYCDPNAAGGDPRNPIAQYSGVFGSRNRCRRQLRWGRLSQVCDCGQASKGGTLIVIAKRTLCEKVHRQQYAEQQS